MIPHWTSQALWLFRSNHGGLEHSPSVCRKVMAPPAMQETQVRSLGQEDPLEQEMATHSSILAWEIPWREEPSRLQSMGSSVT